METTRGCPWMALRLTSILFRGQSPGSSRVVILHHKNCSLRLSGSSQTKAVRSPDMPRRQKAPTPANSNEALTLLTLQQQVLQLTAARATLDEVLELVHETPLYNLTSAQDRRTLNTAQSCLDSLRIRLEAYANTVEDTVRQKRPGPPPSYEGGGPGMRQKQVSLVLRQRQEAAVATELPTDVSAKRKPGLLFQTSTRSGPTAVDEIGSVSNHYWRPCLCISRFFLPFWGGVSVAVSFHLRVTSVYVSHLRLVRKPHTVGCLPMCCPLIHCMAAFYCEDVLCLEGFSARSPGSWQGGSWVSALLSGLFCWTPSQDLAFCSGVLCLFLCKIS